MKLNKQFRLPPVLGAKASAAENEDHGMLSLQLGELPSFRGVIRQLIVGEYSSCNYVRSHINSSIFGFASPRLVSKVLASELRLGEARFLASANRKGRVPHRKVSKTELIPTCPFTFLFNYLRGTHFASHFF
jgi:hypothetical protein